jgi:nicotinamidase-related amidase
MNLQPENSMLLLIDLQERLMPAIAGHEGVVANALRLANVARLLDIPVLATEQNPAGLGPNLPAVREIAARTLTKQFFDATREPAWQSFLPPDRPNVVVAGCEAHVCVLQSVMGLRRTGASVALVRDACGARLTTNRDAAMHRAERVGAELVTTEMVIFEWLATADHPRFREAHRIVK